MDSSVLRPFSQLRATGIVQDADLLSAARDWQAGALERGETETLGGGGVWNLRSPLSEAELRALARLVALNEP